MEITKEQYDLLVKEKDSLHMEILARRLGLIDEYDDAYGVKKVSVFECEGKYYLSKIIGDYCD